MQLGFSDLTCDTCAFIRGSLHDGTFVVILLYVDDFIFAALRNDIIDDIMRELKARFRITDQELQFCLGIRFIDRRDIDGTITLDLNSFVDQMLTRFDSLLPHRRAVSTPLRCDVKLSKTDAPSDEKTKEEMRLIPYRPAIGSLAYLCNAIRIDVNYAWNRLARYMENPGPRHWEAIQDVLNYLRAHPHA
jgi:hypothetical protein